ncbi:hypothetical protein [Streptantibioticus cattleyicolor]|uniref:Uncharacterized protein n=1 Tax=Streptantibioticus cattleyicolor (strain ATCC 35852 / DSM 46488 / JCM 4925 / NBRC 14057 / NRRL 8057) TaxID=1003195 RepID=F8JLU0_STREN|nr:hypothetical protein [Streptantibioticus cattleyicolor]AEW99474.1 hypothetical protein SCATT_p12810 [Streptantibioticus cattleyicolor NRRL 8057 = DSM 46488]CCB71484.1 conserved exported protein of unknown function [Streptantibioticus cattleyicolor NRRL 8057 = DSM 46488]
MRLTRRASAVASGWLVVTALLLGWAVSPARAAGPPRAGVVVPPGVTAGVAVFDRQTGTFTEQLDAHAQFRSASVVKLLIALDHLWDRGPDYDLPPDDRARLDSMLRSSDDDAASFYWSREGGSAIVDRMTARLGLTDTAGPPAGYPGYWGYTALSAADTVTIYRYLLDTAPAPVRDLVMGDLRASTRCGKDGFDQRFGIPASFERPWAVKQGWSGFGSSGDCTGNEAAAPRSARPAGVDLTRRALHTTGTVGAGDRSIIAVFTLQPTDTTFGAAYTNLDRLVRSLNVPGGTHPAGGWYGTWGTGVHVRAATTTDSTVLTALPSGVETLVSCQKQGQTVTVGSYVNDWWAYLPLYGGWITNIYLDYPGNELPDVPVC